MTRISRLVVVGWLLVVASIAAGAPSALAHGPCGCLGKALTEPGEEVRIVGWDGRQAGGTGYPAYRVLFNPRPRDLGIAPAYLASAYRADAPSKTVLSRPLDEPTRKARFRVPENTPAGLYMVLIWDGEEGGAHNTWDYVHVTDRDELDGRGVVARQPDPPMAAGKRGHARSRGPAASGGTAPWPLIAAVALGGLVLGAAAGAKARRRR